MTEIPIIIEALGTVQKNLEKRLVELMIKRKIKTIYTTALTSSARLLRRVLES